MDVEIESLKRAVLGGDWSPETLRALADAQEASAAAAARKRLLRIGATVRVPRGSGTAKAMISDVNDDTMDVVYDDDFEATVQSSAARPLEPFEEEEQSEDPQVLKDRGSTLFKLKDYAAAAELYKGALEKLKPGGLSVGALVMINYQNSLKVGTVSCLEEKTVDLTYDEGDDDDDVPRKAVVLVLPTTEEDRLLLLTTYLNLARCATHAERFKDAVTCSTLASGVAMYDRQTEYQITAKILRARAHLAQSHLKQALRDSAAATTLSDANSSSSQKAQVAALNRDVDKAKRLALKANKRLAKEVTEWVSSAQSKFSENGGNEADCAQQ